MSTDLTIQWTEWRSRAEWDRKDGWWASFVERPDVDCGLWCDPRAVGQATSFEQGESLLLARLFRGDVWVAAIPFKMTRGPVPLRLGLFRVGAVVVDSLVLPDHAFAVKREETRSRLLARVLDEVRATKWADVAMADNWTLGPVADGGEHRAVVPSGALVRNKQPTYVVDMPTDFDTYLAERSANTRQTLRRRVRKMQKEFGDSVHVQCFRAAGEMELLHRYLADVWHGSWHGRLNRQPPPPPKALRSMATQGWLRSYVLLVGEEPVASVLGFQYKGKFLDEAPAYDERWRHFSPGLVLNYFIMEDLFQNDTPRVVDFGFGYNQYKEMLGTREEWRAQLWMPFTPRGRVLVAALCACDLLYKGGKRVLDRTGAVRRLKARMRSRGKYSRERAQEDAKGAPG